MSLIDDSKYKVSIDKLRMGDNYKDVTRESIDKLKRSLMDDGQITPILVDAREDSLGTIIGGNHQFVAIQELVKEGKWEHGDRVIATFVLPKDNNHAKVLALKHNTQYDLPSHDKLAEWGQSLLDTEYQLVDIPVMTDIPEMNLMDVMDKVGPEEEKEEKDPTDKKEKEVICPNCGQIFLV